MWHIVHVQRLLCGESNLTIIIPGWRNIFDRARKQSHFVARQRGRTTQGPLTRLRMRGHLVTTSLLDLESSGSRSFTRLLPKQYHNVLSFLIAVSHFKCDNIVHSAWYCIQQLPPTFQEHLWLLHLYDRQMCTSIFCRSRAGPKKYRLFHMTEDSFFLATKRESHFSNNTILWPNS